MFILIFLAILIINAIILYTTRGDKTSSKCCSSISIGDTSFMYDYSPVVVLNPDSKVKTETSTSKIPTVTSPPIITTQPLPITMMTTQTQTQTQQPTTTTNTNVGGDCVSVINAFRASKGLQPLKAATSEQIACTNESAKIDAAKGFHNSFKRCGERAQCECNGIMPIDRCIQAYINEGPGGGHYDIITNPRLTAVACGGDGNRFLTQNFY